MHVKKLATFAAGLVLASALALTGCSGDDDNGPTGPSAGRELDSGTIGVGETYQHTFPNPGTYPYRCMLHYAATGMAGSVTVAPGGEAAVFVNIADMSATGFQPSSVTVAPGGTVTWTNNDAMPHDVTSP